MSFRSHRLRLLAGAAALAGLLAACGGSSSSSSSASTDVTGGEGSTTIELVMEDIRFDQTALTVKAGETIDFRFTNNGKVPHDAYIGDEAAQMDHEAEMAEMGDEAGHGMEEAALVLQPGESGELSYTFTKPGTYQVGCHQAGHYAAGMKIDVTVE